MGSFRQYIDKVQNRYNLSKIEVHDVMQIIMSGQASDDELKQYLLALNDKGPTVDEITGAVEIMRKFVVQVDTEHEVVLDTCGTGGDHKGTFNISTVSAFVVAGTGVAVAKHGNRSVSSVCGSADLLEGLGVNIHLNEIAIGRCLDEIGIAFLFAQNLHPAMKNVAPVRKSLGVKTIFNILGPLTNPAHATHQMMGVYNRDLVEPMAHVLKNLGLKRALVVHGNDGLDEITITDKTFVSEFNGQEVISYDIDPEELGITRASHDDLAVQDIEDNMCVALEVLQASQGPKRDIVILNAAYALYTAQKVRNIQEGITMAEESIDSGKALNKLNQLKEFSKRVE
ncbi:MAG: anthranilate phosphoribosyltransferase [Candidatus Omnitrophica bacterium]|nr:anthranilate phosphoribosyltransferase [Candidatus Omnitrophota bacterium]